MDEALDLALSASETGHGGAICNLQSYYSVSRGTKSEIQGHFSYIELKTSLGCMKLSLQTPNTNLKHYKNHECMVVRDSNKEGEWCHRLAYSELTLPFYYLLIHIDSRPYSKSLMSKTKTYQGRRQMYPQVDTEPLVWVPTNYCSTGSFRMCQVGASTLVRRFTLKEIKLALSLIKMQQVINHIVYEWKFFWGESAIIYCNQREPPNRCRRPSEDRHTILVLKVSNIVTGDCVFHETF